MEVGSNEILDVAGSTFFLLSSFDSVGTSRRLRSRFLSVTTIRQEKKKKTKHKDLAR